MCPTVRRNVPHSQKKCVTQSEEVCPTVRRSVPHSQKKCAPQSEEMCPTVRRSVPHSQKKCAPQSEEMCPTVRRNVPHSQKKCAPQSQPKVKMITCVAPLTPACGQRHDYRRCRWLPMVARVARLTDDEAVQDRQLLCQLAACIPIRRFPGRRCASS